MNSDDRRLMTNDSDMHSNSFPASHHYPEKPDSRFQRQLKRREGKARAARLSRRNINVYMYGLRKDLSARVDMYTDREIRMNPVRLLGILCLSQIVR